MSSLTTPPANLRRVQPGLPLHLTPCLRASEEKMILLLP